MGRLLRSRRAISPILATLLLIVIVVAASAIFWGWSHYYLTTQMMGERIIIESIKRVNSTSVLIMVRNVGSENATVKANGIVVYPTGGTWTSSATLVEAGQSETITADYGAAHGLTRGTEVTIVVTTDKGSYSAVLKVE